MKFNQQEQLERFDEFLTLLNGNVRHSSRYLQQLPRIETDSQLYIEQKPTINKLYTSQTVLTNALLGKPTDLYYTPNLFKAQEWGRSQDNVEYLTCLWQDIDNSNFIEVTEALEQTELPYPTAIIGSGGGIHLYWIFNNGYRLPKNGYIDNWRKVMHKIADTLEAGLKPDSSAIVDRAVIDSARLMRIAGSYNSKRGKYAHFRHYDPSNTFDFKTDFLIPLCGSEFKMRMAQSDPIFFDHTAKVTVRKLSYVEAIEGLREFEKQQEARQEAVNACKRRNYYNEYIRQDIINLISSRHGEMEGCRHRLLLFLYYLGEKAEKIRDVNQQFNAPLNEKEVNSILTSGKAENRYPKKETVFNDLFVTVEEEKEMKVLLSTDTSQLKKQLETKVSSISGDIQRAKEKVKSLYLCAWLNVEGIKQKDVYSEMSISKSTCVRQKKHWKGFEQYLKNKQELISQFMQIAIELVESISIMVSDSAMIDRVPYLFDKASLLLQQVEQLKQLVIDDAEYSGMIFKVNRLEHKTKEIYQLCAA